MTVQDSLLEEGWARIEPPPALRRALEDFFFDLCRYVLVMVDDAAVKLRGVADFREAVARREVARAERGLQAILLDLNGRDRRLLGKLYDIGTRPMKLMSGMALLFETTIREIIDGFFASAGRTATLARPYNGETLHVFPPGPENFKYNLPVHQDFPYLLQSAKQLTFWLNLTENAGRQAGTVRVYPATHKLGVPVTRKNALGHYEVATERYPEVDLTRFHQAEAGLFELYAIDSLTWHSSMPNVSRDSVRVTYIFRVSDIGARERVPFGLDRSLGDSKSFEELFPARFVG